MIIVNHHKNKTKTKNKSHLLISTYNTTNNQNHLKINNQLKGLIKDYLVNK